jgi:ketosteroid isomerase-like protein
MTIAISLAFVADAQENPQILADKWSSAYNAHDEVAIGALYTDTAQLMMHGAPTYIGRKNIQAYWSADFEEDHPLTLLTVTHSIDGVDMILVHGNYEVINRENGELLGRGRFAHIWTRQPDAVWLLDRDLWSEPFEPF